MNISEELQLVLEAQNNSHMAFGKLYDYYFPRIFNYILNQTGNYENAQDITSEVFFSSVEGIKKFDTQMNVRFGSWLYKVAHNKIVDHIRKNKINFADKDINEVSDEKCLTPEEESLIAEVNKEIIVTLSKINSRYAEVISLNFFVKWG